MKTKAVMSDLHQKFAEKTWNETFQFVRRCMDRSRNDSTPCEPLVRSMKRLQEVFNVSSMNTMRSRLELIAKQQGVGFHTTESACYLTADLFYLEVVLLPCGGVEEVNVAPHGGSPVPSESFLQLLRSKHFAEFSVKLGAVFNQYNIPGDKEIKLKLFESLQSLGKDLQQISHLQRVPQDSEPHVDLINNGSVGCLKGKEDCPLTIQFYIRPADGTKTSDDGDDASELEQIIQAAQVTVGISDVTHKLQMTSLIQQPPQLDFQGRPVFLPLSEEVCEVLPACFLLQLQPAMPMLAPFIHRLKQITDIPDVDLQWAPLPKLLMRHLPHANSQEETGDEQDAIFTVPLPGGVMHSYILPGAAWEAPSHSGAVVDRIPFTHPAHVPALLELLRHQCAINTLLSSCVTSPCAGAGPVCDLHFEVLPESESSFSVTFQRPGTDSLAVLLVNVHDPRRISCTLFAAGARDPSLDEYVSTVMMRCMSLPVTLRMLHAKLEELAPAPSSLCAPAASQAENDHFTPTTMDTSNAVTMIPQDPSEPEDGLGVSDSACYTMSVAKSELPPEINTNPAVGIYPFAPGGVFPGWLNSSSQMI